MNGNADAALRPGTYTLLIAVAVAMALGRIGGAQLLFEPNLHRDPADLRDTKKAWPAKRPAAMPTFSSNDRSRWATVRALVDEGTFVIGHRSRETSAASIAVVLAAGDPLQTAPLAVAGYQARTRKKAGTSDRGYGDSGIIFEDGWESVDKVLNPETLEFYSSKPPLLTTIAAGGYWVLKSLFGWSIVKEPFYVVRTVLIVLNVLPWALYLWLVARMAERFGATEWGRVYVVAAACFGTLLTPFLVTFNNHTMAACSAAIALYAAVRIFSNPSPQPSPRSREGEKNRSGSPLPASGRGAGGVRSESNPSPQPPPRSGEGEEEKTGGRAAPSAIWFLVCGFFAAFTVTNELPALAFAAGLLVALLVVFPARTLLLFLPAALIPAAAFFGTNYAALGQLRPAYSEFGGPWYEYEGAHWRLAPGQVKRGIDWAGKNGETKDVYAFHLLLGHHGLFSLTPIYLLAVAGMVAGVLGWRGRDGPGRVWCAVATFAALLTVVVVGFYVYKSDNYGGWSCGPRWLLWLSPLWLVAMLPAADWLGRRRWGRALAVVLLMASVLSVSYPAWNPWRHPWIYAWMDAEGLIPY